MIYLASGSPRRKKLLDDLSISFEVKPVDADERPPDRVPAEHIPLIISRKKAALCAEQRSDGVIIAGDTVVVDEGQIIGKPSDREEAKQVLNRLRGRPHQVITGVTVQKAGSSSTRESISCVTQVVLRDFSDEELASYVSSDKPLDRAGGYGIQDHRFDPVQSVRGCRSNVLGLPICLIPDLLEPFKVRISSGARTGCRPDRDQECHFDPGDG